MTALYLAGGSGREQLPNNVAIVLPSNGDRTLPAAIAFLRPLGVQRKYPGQPVSTTWHDWPPQLRTTYDPDTIPQELNWTGWHTSEPLDEGAVAPPKAASASSYSPPRRSRLSRERRILPPLDLPPPSRPGHFPVTSVPEQSPSPLLLPHNSARTTPEHEPPDIPREGDPFAG